MRDARLRTGRGRPIGVPEDPTMTADDERLGEERFWQLAAEVDGLLLGPKGELRFSTKRRAALTTYFGMAGIDIRSIRTKEQYLAARKAAAPFFQPWLERLAQSGPMTLERRMLLAAVRGDVAETERLRAELGAAREQGDE
jgi:hypothetical protein